MLACYYTSSVLRMQYTENDVIYPNKHKEYGFQSVRLAKNSFLGS